MLFGRSESDTSADHVASYTISTLSSSTRTSCRLRRTTDLSASCCTSSVSPIKSSKDPRFSSHPTHCFNLGFVAFVANLQKQYLRQQFALFCWVHMSLLVIVVSSHFIINNILEGLIWFFVPASLVICNDVMAYICGECEG